MALISLKKLSDGTSVSIEEANILVAYAISGGAQIEYLAVQSGRRDLISVANTPAEIAKASEKLVVVNLIDYPSTATYINIDRVIDIVELDSVATINYDRGGVNKGRLLTSDTKTEVLSAIYAKLGYYEFEVDSYAGDTIVLAAGEGDVTAKFVVGKLVTVFGAAEGNNDTYIVDSSTFGGGKTTVTLAAGTGVPDDTDTTGYVMIKPISDSELQTAVENITDGTSSFDTISEKTSGSGVTVDGVLLKDGLLNRKTTAVSTTGVTQTLAAGYNDVIFITTTTGTDLAKISNAGINAGHQISLVHVVDGGELVLSKLNAGDGIGFTTITFTNAGDTATLCWSGTAWFIVALRGAVAA